MKVKIATAGILLSAALGTLYVMNATPAEAVLKYKNLVAQKYWAMYGINPWVVDTDGDGVIDLKEIQKKTCPTNPRTIKLTDKKNCLKGTFNLKKGIYTPPKNMKLVAKATTSTSTPPTTLAVAATTTATTSANTPAPVVQPTNSSAGGMFVAPVQALVAPIYATRDDRRLNDLKQLQTALELYYSDNQSYPNGTNVVIGVDPSNCLNSDGWQSANDCAYPYFANIPPDPGGKQYVYTGSGSSYTIDAQLDGTVQNLSGKIRLTPAGIQKL